MAVKLDPKKMKNYKGKEMKEEGNVLANNYSNMSQRPSNKKEPKKFDFKSIGLGAFIALAGLVGYVSYDISEENKKIEAEAIAQEEALKKSYLSEVAFEDIKFSNEAVLFVPKGVDYREVEQTLKNISQKYNIDVSKTVLTDEINAFSEAQEKLVSTTYSEVYALSKKILYKGTTTYDETLGVKTTEAFDRFVEGEDIKIAAQEIANLSGATLEEVTKYIEGLKELENLVLTEPLTKDGGAVLIMFGENIEESRVYIDGTDQSLLEWHLVNNGFLNLNKEDQVEQAIAKIKEGGSYVISIGSNACMFCQNTIPTVEEISADKKVEHIYIDSNTLVNSAKLESFVSSYFTGPIENSPTVVFVNDGKEVSRFTGTQSYGVIEKFVRDSIELVAKKTTKAEDAKVEEEKAKKEEVKAEETKTDEAKVEETKVEEVKTEAATQPKEETSSTDTE